MSPASLLFLCTVMLSPLAGGGDHCALTCANSLDELRIRALHVTYDAAGNNTASRGSSRLATKESRSSQLLTLWIQDFGSGRLSPCDLCFQDLPSTVATPRLESVGRLAVEPKRPLFANDELSYVAVDGSEEKQSPGHAEFADERRLFNGTDLTGWRGDMELWSVENSQIVGRTTGLSHNSFLISDLAVADFDLTVEVLLKEDAGNSGIQIRSRQLNGFEEIYGYQADVGPGWWGKLYEEHGRKILWNRLGAEFVLKGKWNVYRIRCKGSRIQTWINGNECVDLDDKEGARSGVIALQLHEGGPTEVRFRNFQLKSR